MTPLKRRCAYPVKHDKLRPVRPHERRGIGNVTVGIAALMYWSYGAGQIGRAVLVASDRMMTDAGGGIEYEPPQQKVCYVRKHALILAAGDITVHSEAITKLFGALTSAPDEKVGTIASLYGKAIAEVRRYRVATTYLNPLGLTYEQLLDKPNIDLMVQIQSFELNVEALVVGCDDLLGHIFHVRDDGLVTYQHDVNFAAIGIGRDHAKSQFMFMGYPQNVNYYRALPIIYVAKKRAEVAPGVGKETDYLIVTKDATIPVAPEFIDVVKNKYDKLTDIVANGYTEAVDELTKAAAKLGEKFEAQKQNQNPDSSKPKK